MRFFFSFPERYLTLKIRDLLKMDDDIFEYCKKGDLGDVKRLIEESKVDPNEARDKYGLSPLEFVSRHGKLEIVKYLVKEVKVNTKILGENGFSPLHHASCQLDLEVVNFLVEEACINPEVGNKNGNTPLHFASQFGNLGTVKYLVEKCKVNAEVQNINGETPLHRASRIGQLEIVKYFIKYDVDISIKNINGETFLDLFKREQKEEIENVIGDLHLRKST